MVQEEFDQIVCDIVVGNIKMFGQVVENDGFVNGDDMGDIVIRVDNNIRVQIYSVVVFRLV